MTTKRRNSVVLSVLMGGVLTLGVGLNPAHAAQLGPYVGGSYGMTKKNDNGANYDIYILGNFFPGLAYTPTTHDVVFDTEDQGYAGLAGYRIHRYLAIEGMFAYFGSVDYRAISEGTASLFVEGGGSEDFPLTLDTHVESNLTGLGMHALGIYPIGRRWEVYGRGGLQFSTIRTDVSTVRIAGTERVNRAEGGIARASSLDIVLGAGIAMSMFEIYGARLEYVRVIEAGSDAIARGDADMFSLGFIVAF